jgi:hypothetical protein
MAKKIQLSVQKGVRFPIWMVTAIEKIAKERGCTFTDVVHELLRQELAIMGYSMGIGRESAETAKEIPPVKAKKKKMD